MLTKDNVFLPWSEQTEELFKEDLTKDFNIDPSHINAEVVADSVYNGSNRSYRVTTLKIQVPKFILAELNTMRARSLSMESSRAVPTSKMRDRIWENPFVPIYWGKTRSGMTADEQLTGWELALAKFWWKYASKIAVVVHKQLERCNLHKQSANRILEPFMSVTGTITMTDWDNIFQLRYSKFAQPEFIALIKKIHDAIVASTPVDLNPGDVHLPYITEEEKASRTKGTNVISSVARCCRSSYGRNGQVFPFEKDAELFERLVTDCHYSPFEHIVVCPRSKSAKNAHTRNFTFWHQLRSYIEPVFSKKELSNLFGINWNEREENTKKEEK